MDLFVAGCQGLGFALAAGVLCGSLGRRDGLGWLLLAAALVGGAIMCGYSLTQEDHPAWPGWVAGALAAWLAFTVTSDVAAGAAQREGGVGTTAALIALAAIVIFGLSLLFGPLALLALLALAYLAFARHQRAARKYEGLRSLR